MVLIVVGYIVLLVNDVVVVLKEDLTFKGRLWIGDDGCIAVVMKGVSFGFVGFEQVCMIDFGENLVVLGFVDLHSHLVYAMLPLWVEPGRSEPFAHHNVWPARLTYVESVTWPAYAFVEAAPAELLAYAEIRALVGGTTMIQGSLSSNKPLDGWLVRNVEDERFGGSVGANQVLVSTLILKFDQLGCCANLMRGGVSFIYHCVEG